VNYGMIQPGQVAVDINQLNPPTYDNAAYGPTSGTYADMNSNNNPSNGAYGVYGSNGVDGVVMGMGGMGSNNNNNNGSYASGNDANPNYAVQYGNSPNGILASSPNVLPGNQLQDSQSQSPSSGYGVEYGSAAGMGGQMGSGAVSSGSGNDYSRTKELNLGGPVQFNVSNAIRFVSHRNSEYLQPTVGKAPGKNVVNATVTVSDGAESKRGDRYENTTATQVQYD